MSCVMELQAEGRSYCGWEVGSLSCSDPLLFVLCVCVCVGGGGGDRALSGLLAGRTSY